MARIGAWIRGWSEAERQAAAALTAAAIALLVSGLLPYWQMRVAAPQYPKGLTLVVYPDRIEGDVREIDMLNHYIGMRSLQQGALIERRLALPGLGAAAAALLAAVLIRRRWAWMLAVPAVLVPLLFVGDLYLWLRHYGLHLDPKAPLSHAVKPFIPTLLGHGRIAQFGVVAWFGVGFHLAMLAALLAVIGGWLRRETGSRPARALRAAAVAGCAALLLGGGRAQAAEWRVLPGQAPALREAVAHAADGDTVLVGSGIHQGPVVITHAITLAGEPGAVLDGGGQGTVLRVAAPGVTVRRLAVRGSGAVLSREDAGILVEAPEAVIEENDLSDVLVGISLHHAPRSVIRGNRLQSKPLPVAARGDLIRVWYSDGVRIDANRVTDGRDLVFWFSEALTVTGNEVRRGRYGLHFMYCNDSVVQDNHLSDNSVGAYLMYSTRLRLTGNRLLRSLGPSGYGLGLKDMDDTLIDDNVIAGNRVGVFMEHATGRFTGNSIAYNAIGIRLLPTAVRNDFTGNSLVANGEQVLIDGASDIATNRWNGNFWSDYRGIDRDRDGIGDAPYRAVRLFERVVDRYPALRLFADSPAAQALEFSARLFPLFAPTATLVDEHPRMQLLHAGGAA